MNKIFIEFLNPLLFLAFGYDGQADWVKGETLEKYIKLYYRKKSAITVVNIDLTRFSRENLDKPPIANRGATDTGIGLKYVKF